MFCWLCSDASDGLWSRACEAADSVTVRQGKQIVQIRGQVVENPSSQSLLLMTSDAQLHEFNLQDVLDRKTDASQFQYDDQANVTRLLEQEMGSEYRFKHSAHYTVCYNTSAEFAHGCVSLLERLHKGFFVYWKSRGLELAEPQSTCIVMVYRDQSSYQQHCRAELGDAVSSVHGYYSQKSNRVHLLDPSSIVQGGSATHTMRLGSIAELQTVFGTSVVERLIATIVHEATHQLSYNSGLQVRLADHPVWLSEGLALFFESPNLTVKQGWQGIGEVNHLHLKTYQRASENRKLIRLDRLVADDLVFRNSATVRTAYAQSWALTYFLSRTRREQYLQYLRLQSNMRPLQTQGRAGRLNDFRTVFGSNLRDLQREFQRYMDRIK